MCNLLFRNIISDRLISNMIAYCLNTFYNFDLRKYNGESEVSKFQGVKVSWSKCTFIKGET
jgi:hypothetical protein